MPPSNRISGKPIPTTLRRNMAAVRKRLVAGPRFATAHQHQSKSQHQQRERKDQSGEARRSGECPLTLVPVRAGHRWSVHA